MSDIFDDFNKILKKDLVPYFLKYFKDTDYNLPENINSLIDDPQSFLADILEKFSKNKTDEKNQTNYVDIKNVTDIDPGVDEYDNLLEHLNLIEENMIELEKILKDKS